MRTRQTLRKYFLVLREKSSLDIFDKFNQIHYLETTIIGVFRMYLAIVIFLYITKMTLIEKWELEMKVAC